MNITEIKKLCEELPTEPNQLTALEASYPELVEWIERARQMLVDYASCYQCGDDRLTVLELLSELEP